MRILIRKAVNGYIVDVTRGEFEDDETYVFNALDDALAFVRRHLEYSGEPA